MGFSLLEKDKKTFTYFKRYINHLEKEHKTCLSLDNWIQVKEIKEHLVNNGFSDEDHKEVINWIDQNGKPFRDYLNSIKIIYLVWHCMDKKWASIEWDDFCEIEDKINEKKSLCLDTIF